MKNQFLKNFNKFVNENMEEGSLETNGATESNTAGVRITGYFEQGFLVPYDGQNPTKIEFDEASGAYPEDCDACKMESDEGLDQGYYQNILKQAKAAGFKYAWFNENDESLLFNTHTGNTESDVPSFLSDEQPN